MDCTSPDCGRSWKPGNQFPLCITNPCPLRQYRDRVQDQRVSWVPENQRSTRLTRLKGDADTSLTTIRSRVKQRFEPYKMEKAQKATTTVTLKNGTKKKFSTTTNMHSEMVAVQWMLDNGHWRLFLGTIIWADDFSSVTTLQFSTGEPHCGFCTLMLQVLDLPLGKPTKGNYNLAVNLTYPLPKEIRESPYVLARLLDHNTYSGFHRIKRLLSQIIKSPSPDEWVLSIYGLAFVDDDSYVGVTEGYVVFTWDEIIKLDGGKVLAVLWKFVFSSIYNTNKDKE